MHGAGGTEGGVGRFIIGFLMFIFGSYLFLTHVQVSSGLLRGGFGMGTSVFAGNMGSFQYNVTGGMIFVPFIFGVGMVFWNSKNIIGWLLACGSLAAFAIGIIVSVRMSLMPMTAFELITILVLIAGGAGLFGSSLRRFSSE